MDASDTVMVTRVHVKVLGEDGKMVEEGEALQADALSSSGWWVYASNAHGKIMAQAWDLAGNMTELVL